MGRPSQIKPRSDRSNRREFFRRSGTAAAALAAAPLLPIAAAAEAQRVSFDHGVASGDPLLDRVILWTRVTPSRGTPELEVELEMGLDPALNDARPAGRRTTDASCDFTVKIDRSGLEPGTTYYYRFRCKDAVSPIGRTKTLPAGAVDHLRFAVVSCSNFAYGYFNAYRRIAERADLDMVVHLGDYIYEYGTAQYGDARPCEPANEILTLTDYRTRHAQYKRDADSQAMLRQHPLVAIWDDHETANNSWKGGAENHTPGVEGRWRDRVRAALQAYYEWMPVRLLHEADPRRNNRVYRYGDLVDLFLLEERLEARNEQLPPNLVTGSGPAFTQSGDFLDPSRSMLGAAEESWLLDGLHASSARWKIVGQGVMFAQLKAIGLPNAVGGGAFLNPDQWDGYQPSRDRLFDGISGKSGGGKVDNVVILTGDIHSSWAADLATDPNNPLVAAGGYDPASGAGSLAVEFVGTSVTSPGADDPDGSVAALLGSQNPHFKYVELTHRGYMLLDVTADRTVCEWWHLDTVAAVDPNEHLAASFQVGEGSNRLRPAGPATAVKRRAPPLAG